jgi:mono/diheme cytochrome c family protein
MRNISLIFKKVWKSAFVFASLSFLIVTVTQAQDVVAGRTLFKAKCASCHALDHDVTGPALTPKVNELDETFLLAWIKNNVALRASGNAQAIEAAKFSASEMTAFPTLKDEVYYCIGCFRPCSKNVRAFNSTKTRYRHC